MKALLTFLALGASALALAGCNATTASTTGKGGTLGYTASATPVSDKDETEKPAAVAPGVPANASEAEMQRQMREATQQAVREAQEMARQLRESDAEARRNAPDVQAPDRPY